MSTRGTYKIEGKILYHHYDNYPSGAANHLLNVLNDRGAISLLDLLKCENNVNFSFANSIFDGPAEYHYIIKKDNNGSIFVECKKIDLEDNLINLYTLELNEFINTYYPKCYIEPTYYEQQEIKDNEVLKITSKYSKHVSYTTVKTLRKKVEKQSIEALRMLLCGATGNASSSFSELGTYLKALQDEKKIENYNKHIAPMLYKAYGYEGEPTEAFLIS